MALTPAQRAEFETLLTGDVSDAMEMLELRRTVIHGFHLLAAPHAKIIGPAVTLRHIPKHPDHGKHLPLVRHGELSSGLLGQGEVAVVDVGGWTDVGSWGEFHSLRCKQNGAAGAIINGAARDVNLIRDSGFPVMCKGFTPLKSRWDLEAISMGEPVAIAGVQIRAGDIVFGDESGILVVPAGHVDAVLEKAIAIRDHDAQTRAAFMDNPS